MSGIKKRFDAELHRENDGPAVRAVLQYLHLQGIWAAQNDDKYGPDIVVYSGYTPSRYVEVEVKRGWGDTSFPFDSVHLPERKGKYLRKRLGIEYWILNSSLTRAVIIPDYALDSSLLEEVRNKLVSSGEQFYCIPLDQCNELEEI